MKLNLNELILAITHNCNSECSFCMRGKSQKLNMSMHIIDKIFSQINRVEHLVISGGEPSLYPEGIKAIVHYLKSYKCKIGDFFCATNAFEYSEEFVKAIKELYSLCKNKKGCKLSVSIDQFHKPADAIALKKYRKLSFYSSEKEKNVILNSEILSEGNAKLCGIGRYAMPEKTCIYDYSLKGFYLNVGDRIFINAYGNVVLDADLSYENQAERKIGNVIQSELYNILKEHLYKIPEHWFGDGKKAFYKVSIKADGDTFFKSEVEEINYCELPQEAAAFYQYFIMFLRIIPMEPKKRTVPDDLELIYEDLPIEGDRCIGTKIYYKSSTISENTAVTIEVIRCPLTEGILYGGKR